MAHSYSMNPANAAKIGGTGRITNTGGYTGQLTRAEAVTSNNGTLGIEFDFKSDDGATASFLQVWTTKANGEQLSGAAIVDALMLLLRVKDMSPKRVTVEKWDNTTRQVTKQGAECFVELMGKPIGLVLQKEHSVYNGTAKERMQIYAAFDVATRKTPKEIVAKAPKAIALDTILASITDRHEKGSSGSSAPAHHGTHSGARPADNMSEPPSWTTDDYFPE